MKTKLQNTTLFNPNSFFCLKGNDVITAKVSDHHPIIHGGALFWNIMMQGKVRKAGGIDSYNNGFGIVEDDESYEKRLIKVSYVIAEIIYRNPQIETIGLCEGPVKPEHSKILNQSLKKFSWMSRFFNAMNEEFYHPNLKGHPNWGLLMLTSNKYNVEEINCEIVEYSPLFAKLANRFQIWKLQNKKQTKYFALGHFPFAGDESKCEKEKLSLNGCIYSKLTEDVLNYYSNESFILCADFNFSPYFIGKWQDHALNQITHNNSIILMSKDNQPSSTKNVTVDGVLLSQHEKRRTFSLRDNGKLCLEAMLNNGFLKSKLKQFFKHNEDSSQKNNNHKYKLVLV